MIIIKKIGIYSLLSILPIIIGLSFSLIFNNMVILEVVLVVFGLLEILYMNLRASRRNKLIYNNKDYYSEKEYLSYQAKQNILFFSGIINIFISMLIFYF